MNKGILYILISTLCFAMVNFMVKYYVPHLPSAEIVFFRSIITLVLSAVPVLYMGIPFFGNNKKWLLLRGLAGAIALTSFFITIKYLPLPTATTIQYLSPIFTVIIASRMNGQNVIPIQWLFFIVSFAGIPLVENPFQSDSNYLMILLGIFSALMSGIAYNAIIKCKGKEHPFIVVMYFPLVALPLTGIWTYFVWESPSGTDWFYIILIGILTQVAQVFMTMSLQAEKAIIVTPFKYLGVIYAIILATLVMGETIAWLEFVGMGMIVTGILLNVFVTKKSIG
jgi:drug/metabolite transporter (DMT)-like permease